MITRRTTAPSPVVRVLLLTLGAVALLGAAGPAAAQSPTDLESPVTDTAEVLGNDASAIADRYDEVYDATGMQVWIAYVPTFDGLDGEQWANSTATASGLGVTDVLVAVAVDDRRYGVSVDTSGSMTSSDVEDLDTAVRNELRDDDWVGAAYAAADAVEGAPAGGGISVPGGSGIMVWFIGGLLVILVILVGRSVWRRARRSSRSARPTAGRASQKSGTLAGAYDGVDDDELARRASAALVALDDAVTSSAQEVGFAEAEFGEAAALEFRQAVEGAREQLAEAFAAQRTADVRGREASVEVLRLCAEATAALDSHTRAFDDLRDLRRRAPQLLEEAATRADALEVRLGEARSTLHDLENTYPPGALASVEDNPGQAASLITAARASVESGRAASRGKAVPHLRAAEAALDQARTLIDAVAGAGDALATAEQDMRRAVGSLGGDITDAERLAPNDPAVAPHLAEAREALHATEYDDALSALARMTAAEAALDEALAPHRAAAERDVRARALLSDTLGRLDSRIRATADYVATRRGAIGPEARTHLAEAQRLHAEARGLAPTQPSEALALAQRAEQEVRRADEIARAQATDWQTSHQNPSRRQTPSMGGMVLGGILLDQVLRGTGGRGRRGGFGGGFGGGRGGSGGGFSGGGGRSGRGGRF